MARAKPEFADAVLDMQMLTFDAAVHVYSWHGKPVPNVTRIIGHLTDYSRIDPERLRLAQEEGRAVHKLVELDCKDQLDVADLYSNPNHEWLRPRYEAWHRFVDETGFEFLAGEEPMYCEPLGYAGTPDLIGLLKKLPKASGIWNIDVKRSLYAGPAIGLQTAGYKELWDRHAPKSQRIERRGALVLNASGTYRLTPYEDAEDRMAFLACLQQYRWREKHYGRT